MFYKGKIRRCEDLLYVDRGDSKRWRTFSIFLWFNEDAKLAVFVARVSCHDADLTSKGLLAVQPCFEYFSNVLWRVGCLPPLSLSSPCPGPERGARAAAGLRPLPGPFLLEHCPYFTMTRTRRGHQIPCLFWTLFPFEHFILWLMLNKSLSKAWRHAHYICRLLFPPQYWIIYSTPNGYKGQISPMHCLSESDLE